MVSEKRSDAVGSYSISSSAREVPQRLHVKWYRSTFFNATVLGMCNFLAPGLWGAMNSLGAGGLEKPYLVNGSNALTFGLMFLTCMVGSAFVKVLGIRQVLALGTVGYAPYAAALYCNNRYQTEWFVLFGAAMCGLTAGVFWMAEAAVALSYPEPYNKGKLIGYWLSFRVGGNLVGGAINLGINSKDMHAGKVSYSVYIVFITLQALGPFVAFLLSPPEKVQRTDGKPVKLYTNPSIYKEIVGQLRFFLRKDFLLLIPLICQAVYSEAFNYTYIDLYFSVRARALGSFLSAVCCMISGNLLGAFFDSKRISNKMKARCGFVGVSAFTGGMWIWSTVLQQDYSKNHPLFDWSSPGFGRAFGLYLFLAITFQLNYMYLYYIIGNLAETPEEIIRLAALLRGLESASQTVSYGLSSVKALNTIANSAINFGLWGVSVGPALLVIKKIGIPGGIGAVHGIVKSDDLEGSATADSTSSTKDGATEGPVYGETTSGHYASERY